MADKGSQNKTEPPTQKRLRDARRDGDVPRSADFLGFAATAAGVVALVLGGGWALGKVRGLMDMVLTADFNALLVSGVLIGWTQLMLKELALLSIPIVVAVAAVTALAGAVQVGGIFSMKAVLPQLSRVNPLSGLQRMFSMRTFVELFKVCGKFALLAFAVGWLCRSLIPTLFSAQYLPDGGILPLATETLGRLAWTAVGVYALFAVFDLWYQRMEYLRRHRMSKEEVMREYKEMEGDPHVRGMRKQLQFELSMQNMLEGVRKASVVVVNPTHIAVALYYAEDITDLPVVIAKGEGSIAQAIREAAEDAGVPVLRDVQLARRLHEKAPIDQFIPREFIEPVAAVLRWVQRMSK